MRRFHTVRRIGMIFLIVMASDPPFYFIKKPQNPDAHAFGEFINVANKFENLRLRPQLSVLTFDLVALNIVR